MGKKKENKKELPFVSICTPTFNRRPFIPYTIKCFQNQDYPEDKIEWIIIDDGTDLIEDLVGHIPRVKYYKYNDGFLRPHMVSKCIYDFWCGNKNAHTPLRYLNNYRNFFYITKGKIKVKLIPPHYTKYLQVKKDYENGEFISPVNPWNVSKEHVADFNKVKVLDLDLEEGQLLYIPAYWLFTVRYEDISSVSIFCYRTYMNTISIIPDLVMQFLQKQNVKHKVFKSLLE